MLKRFFITGLLIWVPLGITYWVISTIVKTLDGIIPPHIAPQALFGLDIPGFGLLAVVLVVLVTGALGANLLGRRLVDLWEGLLARIPLVRSIYSSVKQVSDTILAPTGRPFARPYWCSIRARASGPLPLLPASQAMKLNTSCLRTASVFTCPPHPTPRRAFSSCCRGQSSSLCRLAWMQHLSTSSPWALFPLRPRPNPKPTRNPPSI